jgi:hypothetical protein
MFVRVNEAFKPSQTLDLIAIQLRRESPRKVLPSFHYRSIYLQAMPTWINS